jgi:5-methylcytosine-specific restriction endonuclease McrA
MGKCIHCNAKVYVGLHGSTNDTVEHVNPLCAGGDPIDPHNLALACSGCNNDKGLRHDKHVGKGGRADEVIAALQAKRDSRWR